MNLNNNLTKFSIATLEKQDYGDPTTAPTGLVRRCLEFVRIPIDQLTVEQQRTLIGQQIGLAYLVPLALDELEKDIITEGGLYPGDLLEAVTKVNIEFWRSNLELHSRLAGLIKRWKQRIAQYGVDVSRLPNL